jgi:hypothetical protein
MTAKQTEEIKSWTNAGGKRIIALRAKGISHEQIAQTIGQTANVVRKRLSLASKAAGEKKYGPRGCYTVKMTDFKTCKVITYKEVLIQEHGSSTIAWNYAMRLIKRRNKMSAKKKLEEFYWIKYL